MSLPNPVIRSAKIFISVLGVFVVLIFVINLSVFDEELNSIIAEEIKPQTMPPAEQNAYIALWGLPAAEGVDFIEAGKRILAKHDENAASTTGDHGFSEEDYKEIYGETDLDGIWLEGHEGCSPRREFGCLERSKEYIETIKSNPRLQLQIQRYRKMISLPYYNESYWDSYNDTLPSYQIPLAVSQTHLSILYYDKSSSFLQAVEEDMNFWRKALDSEGNLITKMISVAAIWRNCLFLSEYMFNRELDEIQTNRIRSILTPLTKSELNIEETWVFERHPFMLTKDFDDPIYYEALQADSPNAFFIWMLGALTQVNATKNMTYETNWKPLEEMSRLPAHELYQLVEQAEEKGKSPLEKYRSEYFKNPFLLSPSILYNLAGKLYLVEMKWTISGYMERIHDLDGMVNLVNLQLEIKQSRNSIESVIENSDFKNPHTLKPMEYDSSEGALSFKCRDEPSQCKIKM